MREIVLDTETTGLDPTLGHRIIEICCIEMENHVPTDRVFHTLIHPERDIPEESIRVHGITLERLQERGSIRLNYPDPFVPFATQFPTPSGRLEFVSERMADAGLDPVAGYTPSYQVGSARRRWRRSILSRS